jgi:hypothetical protein
MTQKKVTYGEILTLTALILKNDMKESVTWGVRLNARVKETVK